MKRWEKLCEEFIAEYAIRGIAQSTIKNREREFFCRVAGIQSEDLSSYESSYPQQIYCSHLSNCWNHLKLSSFNILRNVRLLAFKTKTRSYT